MPQAFCICMNIYIYIYIYIYTHTYLCVCVCVCRTQVTHRGLCSRTNALDSLKGSHAQVADEIMRCTVNQQLWDDRAVEPSTQGYQSVHLHVLFPPLVGQSAHCLVAHQFRMAENAMTHWGDHTCALTRSDFR